MNLEPEICILVQLWWGHVFARLVAGRFGYNNGAPRRASMPRFVRLMVLVPAVFVTAAVASIAQQPAKFEDVVRNLRNPDPKIRISAVRLLRETGYAEAITPLASVITDQVNEIQLEAIDAELSFFLVEPVPTKKRVALVVEVRTEGRAPAAFELGPLAVWPKPVPVELVDAGVLEPVEVRVHGLCERVLPGTKARRIRRRTRTSSWPALMSEGG